MSSYSAESGHRADPETIIDGIQRVLKRAGVGVDAGDRTYRDRNTLSWDDPDDRRLVREMFDDFESHEALWPGMGPNGRAGNARNDCGDKHPFVCDNCGTNINFGRTCAQSVCERCGVAWCRDTAINKSAKARRIRKEKHQHTPSNEHQKFHHQVISPPLEWYADLADAGYSLPEAQDETQKVVKNILDEMRGQGMLIRHSYRFADDDGSIRSETDSRGLYKEVLNSGRSFYGDVRDLIAWKPHYHAVVVSDWLEGDDLTDRVEEQTGWVIHRIADDDGVSIPTDGAMARALTYCLSHADIDVREDSYNSSAVWEVGAFEGDIIKSDSRFTARPSDLDWADSVVRRVAVDTLGLQSGTTECGTDLPAVDDPDELAANIIEELYPDDDGRDVDPDAVLYHVSEGNISVSVSTTSGGGGDVTVTDAWGEPVADDGWGSSIPDVPETATFDGDDAVTVVTDDGDLDDCECGEDHGDRDDDPDDRECGGTLIPLGEARQRGLLDDDEWLASAPFADEARETDHEWPDDLDPWRTSSPGDSIGVG